MHNLQHLLIYVLSLCGMLQLCGADRGSKFSPGPDGTQCILRGDHAEAGEFTYDHVDDSGHFCKCDLCSRGKILHQACLCDPNSSGYLEPSDCRLVNPGEEMMPFRNNCTKGFDCRKCNHPWIVKVKCGLHGPDTECKCADGYYQTSGEECKLYPTCDKGSEPVPGHGDDYSEIKCKQCRPGYYQPTNNSTDKCRPHTNCTTRAGTIQADAQCLNGPSTGGDPSGEFKPSVPSLEETTQDPIPQDIITKMMKRTTSAPLDLSDRGNATTNRTTDVSNGTDVTANATVSPTCRWALTINFPSVVIGFFIGAVGIVPVIGAMVFKFAYLLREFAWFRQLCGIGNPPVEGTAMYRNEEALLVTGGNKTVDQHSIKDSSDVDPDVDGAGEAKQGQDQVKHRNLSNGSKASGSSENLLSVTSH